MHHGTYRVRASSPRRAQALRRSLAVEAGDPLGGARVLVAPCEDDPSAFTIRIDASDLVHLRAATNSFLKWLAAAGASLDAASETG